MNKNVASQKLMVFAFDATTNLPKTGDAANLTAYVSKDYGAVTALGDTSAAEADATNAKGYYAFDLTQAETNADVLDFSCKSSTANIVVIACPPRVFTRPANASLQSIDSNGRIDVIKVAGTTQTAGDLAAMITTVDDYIDTEVAAIKAKTDNLPAAPAAVGDIPTATQNADALLDRDMSAVTVTNARSPINALRFLRNKWAVSGSTLTVYKEDDSTSAWTATVSSDAAADPVVGNDPA